MALFDEKAYNQSNRDKGSASDKWKKMADASGAAARLGLAEQQQAETEMLRENMRLQSADDAMTADLDAANEPMKKADSEPGTDLNQNNSSGGNFRSKTNAAAAADPGKADITKAGDDLEDPALKAAANEPGQGAANGPSFQQTSDEPTLGHGDIAGGSPKTLSKEDQQKVALKEEQRRQRKNENADKRNEIAGGLNNVKALFNRKEIKAAKEELKELGKQKNEHQKNEKEKQNEINKDKKELRKKEIKAFLKIIRMVGELVSAVGIVALIPEIIFLMKNNADIRKARLKMRLAERSLRPMKKQGENINKQIKRKTTELYNLQNIFKREAEPN